MPPNRDQIARAIECHEAVAWAACIGAASHVDGNPLQAEVDYSISTPLSTLAVFDFAKFNRVVALGVNSPATEDDLDAIASFYLSRGQSRYFIEMTPATRPETLASTLRSRGLTPVVDRIAKCWRGLDDIPAAPPDVDVRLLDVTDRDQWALVNVSAWTLPSFFKKWFSATLGVDGFRHYGIFEGDLMVSTGALYVTDNVAWSGFSATRPECRGHGYQTATHVRRLLDARELGCTVVHTEAAADTPEAPNWSLHNQLKLGFYRIYDKTLIGPADTHT
jgi:hypothetical protein